MLPEIKSVLLTSRGLLGQEEALRFTPSSALLSLNVPTEEENHMGWFCVDDDGNLAKKETHPLLVGHMPVMVAKQPEFKVRAR